MVADLGPVVFANIIGWRLGPLPRGWGNGPPEMLAAIIRDARVSWWKALQAKPPQFLIVLPNLAEDVQERIQ